jgi:two-component system LytT family response regulator
MRCVAIDDEPLALDLIKKYALSFPFLEMTATFSDAVAGAEFLKSYRIDLLFVDINMPDLSGLDLVAGLEKKPAVIFTTAHKKFAHEGFELEALDYLLKPILPERFEKAVMKAQEQFELRQKARRPVNDPLIVRSEYKIVKIDPDEIEYIEAMEDYIKIHLLAAAHPILTLMSLKAILEKLPAEKFSRIHRSFIVPNGQVKSIQNKKARLSTDKEIQISDSYLGFIEKWKAL